MSNAPNDSPFSSPRQPVSDVSPPPPYGSEDSRHPAGVTFFAILCFVGAMVTTGLLSFVMILVTDENAANINPVFELSRTSYGFILFSVVSVIGVILIAGQLVAGSKLLELQPLGRMLIMIYAVWAIPFAVVGNAVYYVYLLPDLKRLMARQAASGQPWAQSIMEACLMFVMIGMIVGLVLALLFPFVILWYFNCRDIKALFSGNTVV